MVTIMICNWNKYCMTSQNIIKQFASQIMKKKTSNLFLKSPYWTDLVNTVRWYSSAKDSIFTRGLLGGVDGITKIKRAERHLVDNHAVA